MAHPPKATVTLAIKGPLKSAKRAAARRGIPVHNCAYTNNGPLASTIRCHAACSSQTMNKVVNWFTEKTGVPKNGRGYSPGTLTYHGQCLKADGKPLMQYELGGAKKRSKRRR